MVLKVCMYWFCVVFFRLWNSISRGVLGVGLLSCLVLMKLLLGVV